MSVEEEKKMKAIALTYTLFIVVGTLFLPKNTGAEELLRLGDDHRSGFDITVVVDNHASRRDLETVWGFSCVIRGFEKTILFDTGKDGDVLMHNLEKVHIAPGEIDVVFLSHAHRDHTGGLKAFLSANPRVIVYLLSSSPKWIFDTIRGFGATPISVTVQTEICRGLFSTGALGTEVEEQSLVLRKESNLAVITGCAHPGIADILRKVKSVFPSSDILIAMGGFHLLRSKNIENIVKEIYDMGVHYIAPCHCSGTAAKRLFRRRFKAHFITVSAGVRLMVSGIDSKSKNSKNSTR